MWKLNNTLLNNQYLKEKITSRIDFVMNENKTQQIKTYGMQQEQR